MKTLTRALVLATCLLLPLAGAAGAAPAATGLQGANAVVVGIDPASHTLTLNVPTLANDHAAFSVSPLCVYANGLASLASLHVNSRILVWTQAPQQGTLPVIIKMTRAEY